MNANTTDRPRVSWPVLLLQAQDKLLNCIQFCNGDRRLEVRRDNRQAAIDKNSLMSLGLDRKSHETISGNQRQTCWQNQPAGREGGVILGGGGGIRKLLQMVSTHPVLWMNERVRSFRVSLSYLKSCFSVWRMPPYPVAWTFSQGNTVAFVILCAV